jgi:hypothetical protein
METALDAEHPTIAVPSVSDYAERDLGLPSTDMTCPTTLTLTLGNSALEPFFQ